MNMHADNLLRCSNLSIIIILIVINLTSYQCQLNGTENVTKDDDLLSKFAENDSSESELKLLVEPYNLTDSLNNEQNNGNSNVQKTDLMDLDELKMKNYTSAIENDRTQILNQLDNITESIDSILDEINSNGTSAAPQAPSSRPKCTITKEKLERVQKEIQSMLSNITDKNGGDSKCTLNFDNTDNCNNLVKAILCGLNHVKKGFHDALSDSGSAQEVTKWKNAFDALTEKFEQEKDNLIQSLSHKHQLELDKLKKEIQNLRKQLITKEENTIELCVTQIAVGQVLKAVDRFMELSSTPISVIVKKTYHFNEYSKPDELERLGNIDEFIQHLPQFQIKRDALKAFFNEMNENNHLKTIRVLIINYTYNRVLSRNEKPNEIKKNTDLILSEFFDVIAFNRNNSEFNKFIQLHSGRYFNIYAFNLLNRALNNKSLNEKIRLKYILDSIRRFPCDHATEGLLLVNNYMISNKLVYNNTNTLTLVSYANHFYKLCNANSKRKLEIIRKKFPQVVKFVDNLHKCRLKNVAWPLGYLYSQKTNDESKVILYNLHDNPAKQPENVWWKFETSNNCDSFTLKNRQYDEYLFSTDTADKNRRQLDIRKSDKLDSWEIVLKNGGRFGKSTSDYFTVKNIRFNEYLFSYSVESLLESVPNAFTWQNGVPTEEMWATALWEMECVNQ